MGERPPSSYAVSEAMRVLTELREQLLAIDPTIADDETLLHDMLEAEGDGAIEVIERVIRASIEAESMADGAKRRRAELGERQARFERRRAALRDAALAALSALGLRKLERPDFSVFVRAGQPELIVDEAALDPAFVRTKYEVDRALIRKQLAAGIDVAGAVLGNARPSITVKVT